MSRRNGGQISVSSKKRMEADVMKLLMSDHDVKLIDDCMNKFHVTFKGPNDSPYADGYWLVRVELPTDYPYKSPSIGFQNRIFHPNIDENSGSVCLDVINQTWSPMYELINVFEIFLPQLLLYPNASDPLNGQAASLYSHSRADFDKRVKETVERYATLTHVEKLVGGDSSQEYTQSSSQYTQENGEDDDESDDDQVDEDDDDDGIGDGYDARNKLRKIDENSNAAGKESAMQESNSTNHLSLFSNTAEDSFHSNGDGTKCTGEEDEGEEEYDDDDEDEESDLELIDSDDNDDNDTADKSLTL